VAKKPKLYTKLSRNSSGFAGHSSLWAGAGHLMIVGSTGYTESYARIEFRDIQAFVVTGSRRRTVMLAVFGVIALIGAALLILLRRSVEYTIISVPLLAAGVIGLAINLLLGPSCVVHVVTHVQTTKLPSILRRRKARKVLARLEPEILATQAGVQPSAQEPAAPEIPPLPQ
jgi:hypothetical protein